MADLALKTGVDVTPWVGEDVAESSAFMDLMVRVHNFNVTESERRAKKG